MGNRISVNHRFDFGLFNGVDTCSEIKSSRAKTLNSITLAYDFLWLAAFFPLLRRPTPLKI